MPFWNRKKKPDTKSIALQINNSRLQQENTKLKIINKMAENMTAQMKAFVSRVVPEIGVSTN